MSEPSAPGPSQGDAPESRSRLRAYATRTRDWFTGAGASARRGFAWTRARTSAAGGAIGLDRLGRTPRIILWSLFGLILTLVALWIAANILLAQPRFATPLTNWGLRTFAAKEASVETARLERPFARRFLIDRLDWPARAEADSMAIDFDLFGWLPGRPWTRLVIVRDGEVMLGGNDDRPTTFQPQNWLDRIDAENFFLRFTRRGEAREVLIVSASGSFQRGTVRAEATAADARLTFEGLTSSGGALRGDVTAKGQNIKHLAELLGASAPDTPPFDLTGQLVSRARTWSVENLAGTMGDSDLAGSVAINLRDEKPLLNVDLQSRRLDFDDLGVVFGIPIGVGEGETANEDQVAARRVYDQSDRLIPDAEIDFSRLAAVNADFAFVASEVVDAPAGITALNFQGDLRNSVLSFERARVRTTGGDLDAQVRIDATRDPASTTASGRFRNLSINRIIPTPLIRGTLNGVFGLELTGSGFRDAFGTATGQIGAWSTDSELAKLAVEAAGLDIGEVLLVLMTSSPDTREYLPSRCLVVNLSLADGRIAFTPAVIDNDDTLILATGFAELKTEGLSVEIIARPKDISIGRLFGDIRIGGTLRNPQIDAPGSGSIVQAGIAAILSSLAAPLAALPFLELGGGESAPCADLYADARQAGSFIDPTLPDRARGGG